MIGFFIALISGALMSVQGVFNTQVTKNVGDLGGKCICAVYGAVSLLGGMAAYGQVILWGTG